MAGIISRKSEKKKNAHVKGFHIKARWFTATQSLLTLISVALSASRCLSGSLWHCVQNHGGASQTLKAGSHKHEQSWHLSLRPAPLCQALNKSFVLCSCDLLPWEIRTAPLQHPQPPPRQCTRSQGWLKSVCTASSSVGCWTTALECWHVGQCGPQRSLLRVPPLRASYSNESFHK